MHSLKMFFAVHRLPIKEIKTNFLVNCAMKLKIVVISKYHRCILLKNHSRLELHSSRSDLVGKAAKAAVRSFSSPIVSFNC